MGEEYYVEISARPEEQIDTLDNFGSSIFSKTYEELYRVLGKIIETPGKKHGDMITLLGPRGSGKTSVMVSFSKSLQETENPYLEGFLNTTEQKVRFSVLENIDASLLDSEEDVFDIILGRMLKNVDTYTEKKQCDQELWRQIDTKFEHIYASHQMIKEQKKEDILQEYSSLSALRRFADSCGLMEEFEELVELYLQIMLGDSWDRAGRKSQHYLVVMVDDLDMNIRHGFRSLEQIHRYVSVKNVIVVVAAKYDQIEKLVEKSAYELFPKINRQLEDDKLQYVSCFSKEYLDKLLPIQRRVHMPDMNYRLINPQKRWYIKEGRCEYTVKQSILRKLRERTGICFDICGKKRHFLEPRSLRELNGYYNFLDKQLKRLEPDLISKLWKLRLSDRDKMHDARVNCDQVINDFIERIVYERLDREDRERVFLLLRLDYEGFNSKLFGECKNMVEKKLSLNPLKAQSYFYKRGYGEILRLLYQCSRSSEAEKEYAYAIFTVYTYLIWKEFLRGNEKKEGFQNLLKGSWAGSWSNYMVPRLRLSGKDDEKNEELLLRMWGCMQKIDCGTKDVSIDFTYPKGTEVGSWIRDHQDHLTVLEWMFFFFERFYAKSGREEPLRLQFVEKEGHFTKLRINNSSCDFNILAFIRNSFYYETFFEQFYSALAKALAESFGWQQENTYMIEDVKKQLLEASVLHKEYREWVKTSRRIAVPFQYTDMYYHILHRLQQMQRSSADDSIKNDLLLDVLQETYQTLGALLKEQDEGYGCSAAGAGDSHVFQHNFLTCPFIKIILEQADMIDKERFGKLIEKCAENSKNNTRNMQLLLGDELTTSSEEMDW